MGIIPAQGLNTGNGRGGIKSTPETPQAIQRLKESRQWLRATFSSIGNAVIGTDASGAVTFLNPVAESLTGWSQAEAAGVAPVLAHLDRRG